MAIIIPKRAFVRVDEFLDGLRRATQGTMRVIAGSRDGGRPGEALSTAWLITDSLVVLADYVVRDQKSIGCCPSSEPDRVIGADLVSGPPRQPLGSRPALLRLREPLPGRAQVLYDQLLTKGEAIFLILHPDGRREPFLSSGQLLADPDVQLRYDANTEPGSSGAPVLSVTGKVAGMHIGRGDRESFAPPTFNYGLSLGAILRELRTTAAWGEIARYHRLSDVTAAPTVLESSVAAPAPPSADVDRVVAAVHWSFDPTALPEVSQEVLRPLVVEPTAKRWILRANERRRIIDSKPLQELRQARGSAAATEPGQQVIDRVLKGPPYSMAEIDEKELPYWLQVVRWFGGAALELPKPADINRELERRRVRSRLHRLAGPTFRGRARELADLRSWFHGERPGPMVIAGIGGVGKSALVARFAEELPVGTTLLWLDFDRADLVPDDAVSVLTLLAEQAVLQLAGFAAPAVTASNWADIAKALGDALALASAHTGPPLLVLDGFEVAQYVKQYHEIWRILGMILRQAPSLRVLIAGRAPVAPFELEGRRAINWRLSGIDRADAAAWLGEHGVRDERVLQGVLDISDCIPLALKFTVRLIEEGGEVEKLPEALPSKLLEGVLYQRVLDRVIAPELREIARDALVLRRLTAEMIPSVLPDHLPKGLDIADVFGRLSRELALVEGSGDSEGLAATAGGAVLRLRPEVRSATLRLLEMADAPRVRRVDERAAAWYAGQNPKEVANAAELVYHRLRLGDVSGAAQAWRPGCTWRLLYAEEELPESPTRPRDWLRERIEQEQARSVSVREWEQDAAVKIRSALQRGVQHVIPEILASRTERSLASPLLLYDAWLRWQQTGDPAVARAVLAGAAPAGGPVYRDRAILAALLAARAGERREADGLLASVQDRDRWNDRGDAGLHTLAVQAARVRLTVDLEAELALAEALDQVMSRLGSWDELRQILSQMDVTLPSLISRFARTPIGLEAVSVGQEIQVPDDPQGWAAFPYVLENARRSTYDGPPLLDLSLAVEARGHGDPWRGSELKGLPEVSPPPDEGLSTLWRLGLDLAVLGWRRWRFIVTNHFLAEACDLPVRSAPDQLALSIVLTLGTFCFTEPESYTLLYKNESLGSFFEKALANPSLSFPPPAAGALLAQRVVRYEAGPIFASFFASSGRSVQERSGVLRPNESVDRTLSVADWLEGVTTSGSTGQSGGSRLPVQLIDRLDRRDLRRLCKYLLGPDPLETLARGVIGLPESINL